MYGQIFLLSLVAHGLGRISQTLLGMFSDTIREVIRPIPKLKLLFGISFGYPNPESPSNDHLRMDRAALEECITFHG